MHFKKWLNEKVSKSELNQIFSDSSILVGAEFEFYASEISDDVLEPMTIGGYSVEEVHSDHNNFVNKLRRWIWDVQNEEEAIYNEINKLEDKISEIENYEENVYKEVFDEDPDEKIQELKDKIEELEDERTEVFDRFDIPSVPDSLIAMNNLYGFGLELDPFPYIEYLEDPDKIYDLDQLQPGSPDDYDGIDSEEFFDKVAEEIQDNVEGFDYEIKMYQSPGKNDNWWGMVEDGSVPLSEGGLELVSPPLPLPEFIEIVPKIFDFIEDLGHTDYRCGFHVSISINGVDLKNDLDILKLLLFHDEELVYKGQNFKNREGNRYAQSVKTKMKDPRYEFDDLHKIIKIGKLEKKFTAGKFYGINLDKVSNNYLEFRYMGGDDYEKKWDNIKTLVGNHAYNLKLAADVNFKKREYTLKLATYIDKHIKDNIPIIIDIVFSMYMVEIMRENFGNNIKSNEIIKEFWQKRIDEMCDRIYKGFQPKDALRNFKLMDIDNDSLSTTLSRMAGRAKSYIHGELIGRGEVVNWLLNELEKIENMNMTKLKLLVYRALK